MSMKRSRMYRSSSQGEIGLLNEVKPILSHAPIWDNKYKVAPISLPKPAVQKTACKNSKPTLSTASSLDEQPRKSIWTVSSPSRELNDASSDKSDDRFGDFLNVCYLCKKKFDNNSDIFMYGCLRSFCSPNCRDDQIALDGLDKESTEESSETMTANLVMKNAARKGFGTGPKPKC